MTSRRRAAGFTLVEVLVGTTLLTMMLGLLMSALFSMTRGARAGESKLAEVDTARLTLAFLRRQISGAAPITVRSTSDEHVLFDGSGTELRFVGHLPAHRGGGGLQFLELTVDRTAAEPNLVLRSRNAWSDADFSSATGGPDWDATVLLREVETVRFSYYGTDDDRVEPRWTERWTDRRRLPQLVKVEIEQRGEELWPALAIAVHTTTAAGQPQLFRAPEVNR
jgi:general secretion pathway protein J